MTATLPNGTIISGTPEEMKTLLLYVTATPVLTAPPPFPPNSYFEPDGCPTGCAGGRKQHDKGCMYDPATYAPMAAVQG